MDILHRDNNNIVNNSKEEGYGRLVVKEYFDKTPRFNVIPSFYQNQIIDFFCERSLYFIDPVDIKGFFSGGKSFQAFSTFYLMEDFLSSNIILGVLGCNRFFETRDKWGKWVSKLDNLKNYNDDDIDSYYLTHGFGFNIHSNEEWYIVSYA